jgi:hypothetical protein
MRDQPTIAEGGSVTIDHEHAAASAGSRDNLA